MNKRPLVLQVLAGFMLIVGISFPVQAAFIYGLGIADWHAIFHKVSVMNWFVSAACLVSVPLILRASRWILITIPIAVVVVAWNNFVVGSYAQDFSLSTTTWATILFTASQGVVLSKEIVDLLKRPKERRWLQSKRQQVTLPVTVQPTRAKPIEMKSFDISETGAFLACKNLDRSDLDEGDRITMKLSLGTLRQLKCDARVVRRNISSGKYPGGLGIEFTDMSRGDRRALRKYLSETPQRADHLT